MSAPHYNELIEALQNLMGAFDTPIARKKITGEVPEQARKEAREILERYEQYQKEKEEILVGIGDLANKEFFLKNAEKFFGWKK